LRHFGGNVSAVGVAGVAGKSGEVTRSDVIGAARRRFLRSERIDLVAIAEELGVARATLYRWHGDRDHVAGQVLLSLAEDTLDLAIARRRPAGAAGVAEAIVETLRDISGHPGLRAYIAADPQRAMTVLTGRGSVVAAGMAARFERLVLAECPDAVGPDVPIDDLAYALLRLAEAYCYSDVIAGRHVDVDRARPLFLRLLEAR
jgi:AcrR family transcriptional regulator